MNYVKDFIIIDKGEREGERESIDFTKQKIFRRMLRLITNMHIHTQLKDTRTHTHLHTHGHNTKRLTEN